MMKKKIILILTFRSRLLMDMQCLINKNKFNNDIYFDENFFLYLENDDLCKRLKKNNNKIYVAKKAKINHLGEVTFDLITMKLNFQKLALDVVKILF